MASRESVTRFYHLFFPDWFEPMNRKLLNLIFLKNLFKFNTWPLLSVINRLGVKPELLQQKMGLLRLRNTALNSDYIILRIGITNVAGPDPKEPYHFDGSKSEGSVLVSFRRI